MVHYVKPRFEQFPQMKAIKAFLGYSDNENMEVTGGVLERFGVDTSTNVVDVDLVIENQRGMKFFGVPMFSSKTLIPRIDPPTLQLISGKDVLNAAELLLEPVNNILSNNYPLPDIGWEWAWDTWYVIMLYDVDDHGWIYLYFTFYSKRWKGRYYFGNFVRRRIWARLRTKKGHTISPIYLDLKNMTGSKIRQNEGGHEEIILQLQSDALSRHPTQNIESELEINDVEMVEDGATMFIGAEEK